MSQSLQQRLEEELRIWGIDSPIGRLLWDAARALASAPEPKICPACMGSGESGPDAKCWVCNGSGAASAPAGLREATPARQEVLRQLGQFEKSVLLDRPVSREESISVRAVTLRWLVDQLRAALASPPIEARQVEESIRRALYDWLAELQDRADRELGPPESRSCWADSGLLKVITAQDIGWLRDIAIGRLFAPTPTAADTPAGEDFLDTVAGYLRGADGRYYPVSHRRLEELLRKGLLHD